MPPDITRWSNPLSSPNSCRISKGLPRKYRAGPRKAASKWPYWKPSCSSQQRPDEPPISGAFCCLRLISGNGSVLPTLDKAAFRLPSEIKLGTQCYLNTKLDHSGKRVILVRGLSFGWLIGPVDLPGTEVPTWSPVLLSEALFPCRKEMGKTHSQNGSKNQIWSLSFFFFLSNYHIKWRKSKKTNMITLICGIWKKKERKLVSQL